MSTGGPLTGIRVLDLTQVVSGPACTMLLADLGAEVIKVERPDGGDPYRQEGRVVSNERGSVAVNFLRLNRNKQSVTINLKDEAGRDLLRRLVARSDVLVENFRPGVLERLGLGWPELRAANPRLVYASISGFGHDDLLPASPYSSLPAYAIICEAYAGILHLVGEAPDRPPHWLGFALADLTAGLMAVIGIFGALRRRDATGEGQRVDISMYDAAMFMNDQAITLQSAVGEVMTRGPYTLQAPWGLYPVRDGYVAIAVMGERQWQGLCRAIGREDLAGDPRCASGSLRAEHMDDVIMPVLGPWLLARDRREVTEILQRHDVPSAPVHTAADLFTCGHVEARHMLVPFDHPVAGTVHTVGNPVKISGHQGGRATPPPELGQHTDQVLTGLLGLDDAEIARLREGGVI